MIAQGLLWRENPISEDFFKPKYQSDSESNLTPDLRNMETVIPMARYQQLRNGAAYEMLTPGWRSQEVSGKLFGKVAY